MRASVHVHDTPDLELALLRRGVNQRTAGRERCDHCHRTPLIGERIYVYDTGSVLCELCRTDQRDVPRASRLVHGPEFGHTMRLSDRRAA
jgi:hypothetical protein